jgi:hypothetical protein
VGMTPETRTYPDCIELILQAGILLMLIFKR